MCGCAPRSSRGEGNGGKGRRRLGRKAVLCCGQRGIEPPRFPPAYSGLGVPSLCSAGASPSTEGVASGALSLFSAFSAFFFFFSNSLWRFSN